ncbi:hypothetical protein [Micromonospora sp. 4G55]|uniref:hypothetical protein n=1 Tax=Micromonospora sp. 4G55 TaxID=2806102 RepID=UPI001A39B8ED|nr:hypothetical protein [Micromonospora sp. 4G55]MBM0255898.1 hypothetical protein [Micromonospora sp. 4G55]
MGFWREPLHSFVASCLILACACLGVAIGRLPRERLRRIGRAAPAVGVHTLVTLVFVALLPSGLTALLGSFTNVAVAALLVLGGYAWVVLVVAAAACFAAFLLPSPRRGDRRDHLNQQAALTTMDR